MPNENVNHVVINGVTKIDLRADTVTVSDVTSGVTFHLASGATATGTLANGDPLSYGVSTQPLVGTARVGAAVLGA